MRSSPVELRRATCADATDIADVFAASCRHAYQDVLPPSRLAKYVPGIQIPRWTAHFDALPPGHRITVACQEESVIGFLETRHNPPTGEHATIGGIAVEGASVGEVTYLFVDPRCIGTGVGRLLLAEGEEWFTSTGMDTAILWVFSDNLSARAFYERSGWTYAGHEQLDAGLQKAGFSVRERLYHKELNKPLRQGR
ncbi:GNAT family N-acetyltransferase [Streptomyces flaveus]|uniref:GNAT family N-acetyltransferase n=1 Tax=Streptomyces flaveus TaxID=66370 RepID=UPI00331C27F4